MRNKVFKGIFGLSLLLLLTIGQSMVMPAPVFATEVNLGRIKPIYQGTYSAAVVYKPLDFVKYNGITYFCILQTTAGILPTNVTYFQEVAPSSMLYPDSGIPQSTGSAWGTSLTFSTSTSLGTSDTTIPSQNAIKTYADTKAGPAMFPGLYQRDRADNWVLKTPYSTAANRYTILTPTALSVAVNGTVYYISSQTEIDVSNAANWDNTSPNYTTAANRAGLNFYIYACVPVSGTAPKILLSASTTYPSGYNTTTSRKIGGFHGLCVAVGTISGHTLTGFVAGDVLPASIWDLNHRPVSAPEGMVYSEGISKWVDIYLASGTGSSTASVYAATITDTRDWNDFTDDGGAVKKKMLTDPEFQVIATGSNEGTNIYGSGDPGTTGGHIDSASRRMISNIGVEDACGALQQWLSTQSYIYTSVNPYWGNLPGGKGSYYGNYTSDPGASEMDNADAGSDVKLLAGGAWGSAAHAGSRCRDAGSYRWIAGADLGCRFCAEPV